MTQYGVDTPDLYDLTMQLVEGCNPDEAHRQVITEAIQKWRQIRAARLDLDKKVEEFKKHETALKNWVMQALNNQHIEGMVVDGRITSVTTKNQPVVEDKFALSNYILETRQLDLLQFRLSSTAINERVEQGVTVPGVGFTPVHDLSDRKAK